VFKLDTVTYGTKPASFLAVQAMHQLAADEHTAFPLGAEVTRRDFYVDDLISGAKSKEEAVIIMDQASKVLAQGNFSLESGAQMCRLFWMELQTRIRSSI